MSRIFQGISGKLHLKFLIRSIFVLTLGVVTFEAISFYQMSKMVRELTVQNVKLSVEQASNQLESELAQLSNDVETISSLPALESYYLNLSYGLDSEAKEYLKSVEDFFTNQSNRNPSYLNLKICDLNTSFLALYNSEQPKESILTVSNCQAFETKSAQRFIAQSKTQVKPVFAYSQVIMRDDEKLGIIEVQYNLKNYFEHVNHAKIQDSGYLAVIDKQNNPLSTNQRERVNLIKELKPSNVESAEGFTSQKTASHQNYLVYRAPLEAIDWLITGIVDESKILNPL